MNDEMKQNDQHTESLVKYTQRDGTKNSGGDYEAKILALIALRCVSHDFEDVWLGTNVDKVGKFDDIILQVKKPSEDSRCTFMLQLKHADKPKDIEEREFMPDVKTAKAKFVKKSKVFNLLKYAESFSELIAEIQSSSADDVVRKITNSNTTFLFFTNRSTNEVPFFKSCPITSSDFLNTSETGNVYKFDFDKLAHSLNNMEYCKNIRLFSNQIDVNKVDNLIVQELPNALNHFGLTNKNNEGTAREFERFIKYWKNRDFGCTFYLTKQCILDKLCELLLCQYAVDFLNEPVIFYASDREKLWSKIITEKFITIIDHNETTSKFLARYIGSEMQHYMKTSQNWSDVLSKDELGVVDQNLKLKTRIIRSIGKHKSITSLDIYKCLWLNGSIPLLLEIRKRDDYEDIIKILEKCRYKFKVIIINKSADALSGAHRNVPYFFTLSDLEDQDRTQILDLPIKLQGKAFSSLYTLIDKSMMEFIKASDVISILTDNFNIGNQYPQSPDLENVFISRSLSKIIFKHDVVNQLKDENFVIEWPFSMINYMQKNIFNVPHEETKNAIICNEEDGSNEVEKLKIESKVPIHRLRFYSSKYFEWKETIGSIKNISQHQCVQESELYQYVDANSKLPRHLHDIDHFWIPIENILDNSNPHLLNKLNIIDAGPGMGKTTLLDFVARSSDLWTVKIDLSDHHEYFEKLKRPSRKLKALDHLQRLNELIFKRCNYSDTTLSQKVFQKLLEQKMVFILIDGFDEISISYKNEVTQLIKTLLEECCPTWITTRSIRKSYLEEEFNTISVTLKPFNANEQTKFLLSYFTQECINNISKDVGKYSFLIQEFVNRLLDAACINFNNEDIEFSSFPLHIKLLAEVFSDKFKESLNSKIIDFNERFDLLYLYKDFFNKKHEIFYEKHGPTARAMHRIFQYHQQLFALSSLFCREDLSELNIDKELNDYCQNKSELLQLDGIIVDQIGSTSNSKFSIRFVHRSFAEYLAAEWLAVNITSDSKRNKRTAHSLAKQRFDQNFNLSVTPRGISYYRFLFEVFDRMVSQGHNLHLAIINKHFIDVKHIIESNPDSVTEVDKCGRTILHMAALYGVSHLPRFTGSLPVPDETVDIIDQIPQSSVWEMNKDILGYDPLYCAIANNTLAVADKICEKSTINLIIQNYFDISSKETYIRYCVVLKYKSLFKLLLPHFAFRDLLQRNVVKDMTIKGYCNHLSNYRFSSDDLLTDFIAEYTNQTIWTLCSSVISPPEKYYTEIGLAAAFGSVKNIRKLLRKQPTLINFQDIDKNTALHYAVIHTRLEVVKMLLAHGADISKAGFNNYAPLHFAVQTGQKELVEELLLNRPHIDQLNGNNNSPLYLAVAQMAVTQRGMDILNLLLSKGADCNVGSGREGNSCLHYACELGRVDIAKALLCKGANVNSFNFSRETPLHLAARNRGTELVELLLYYKANVSALDKNGIFNLQRAVGSGNVVVDRLLKARENQTQQFDETLQYFRRTADTKIDTTLMHLVVINGRVDIAKYLLAHGESCNAIDINQRTPLHYAAEKGYNDIVDLLLSKDAHVDMQDVHGDTSVHLALKLGQLGIAKMLLSRTKSNTKNNVGNSVLHYAVAWGDKDIILKVLSEGADINCLNYWGNTPLNVAIMSTVAGSLKTIKLLSNNQLGYSPIHSAAYLGKIELLHPLLDHHNNASLPNQRNQTPLHFSMIDDNVMFTEEGLENQKQVVRLLLDSGANCNICDFVGNTVLHYASTYNTRSCYTLAREEMKKCLQHFHKCIVQLLISRGADKTITNQEGFTAESLASKWGCTDMVGLLH